MKLFKTKIDLIIENNSLKLLVESEKKEKQELIEYIEKNAKKCAVKENEIKQLKEKIKELEDERKSS